MGSSMAREFHVNNTLSHFSSSTSLLHPPPSSLHLPHILMPSNDGENKKKLIIVFARRNKWKKTRNSIFYFRRGELEVTPKP